MSVRKRAFLLAIAAAGVVAAVSGAMLEGCVAIGFAVEAYLVCSTYLLPAAGDDDHGGDGGLPEDPWPLDPGAGAPAEPARPLVTA